MARAVGKLMGTEAVGNAFGINFRGYRGAGIVQDGRKGRNGRVRARGKWSPSELGGLIMWLDFGRRVTYNMVGPNMQIQAVGDLAVPGRSVQQLDPAKQPFSETDPGIGNGRRFGRGDGVDDYLLMAGGSFAHAQPFTICWVGDEPAVASSGRRMLSVGSGINWRLEAQVANANCYRVVEGLTYNAADRGDGSLKRWMLVANASSSQLLWNLVAQKAAGNIGASASNSISIFAGGAGTGSARYRLFEIMAADHVLSAEERVMIDVYFRDKFW